MDIGSESLFRVLDDVPEKLSLVSVPDFRILYANRLLAAATGVAPESVRGLPCHTAIFGRDKRCDEEGHECPVRKAAESGVTVKGTHECTTPAGGRQLVEITADPIRNDAGKVICVAEIVKTSREGEGLYEELRRKAEFLEKILHTCPEGIVGNDTRGNIFLYNAGAERIFGYPRDAVVGRINVADLYPPGGAREVKEFVCSSRYGGWGRLIDFETEVVDSNGKRIPIRLGCSLLHDGDREVGMIGFFTDISSRRVLQEKFLESEERFRGIFESAPDGIISVSEDGSIMMVNNAAETILGYAESDLRRMNVSELFPAKYGDTWREIRAYAAPADPANPLKTIELTALHRSGRPITVQMSLAEKSVRGQTLLTAIIRDISERKAIEEELRLLSITDSLTHLYNRRHFVSLAQKELDRAIRNKTPFSVLLIDVDRFKQYNDSYGHAEGDDVLKTVGRLAAQSFRTMDSCFRFGGEEFLILLPETSDAGAMVAAERFRVRISDTPFRPVRGGKHVHLSVSIGIAEYHAGYTLDDLTRVADLAMYAAKNGGRNRTVSYEDILSKSVPVSEPPG